MWDPDVNISDEIENKRTELNILFGSRVDKWLNSHPQIHEKRPFYLNARLVLTGKIRKLSMRMLDPLSRLLTKEFDTLRQDVLTIDLSSDEDDSVVLVEDERLTQIISPQRETSGNHPSSLPLEIIIDGGDSRDEVQFVQPPLPVPVKTSQVLRMNVPIPEVNLMSAESLELPVPVELITPATEFSTNIASKKQRRLSVNSRPNSSKDLPSISDYKIKTPSLKPPSIYAKTGEETPRTRQIISVEYKNKPRPKQAPYDPKEEAQKLHGITEKIYANKYLPIEVAHKMAMQKELEKKLSKENEDKLKKASDVEVQPVPTKKRRKSTCNPKLRRKSVACKDDAEKWSDDENAQPLAQRVAHNKKTSEPKQLPQKARLSSMNGKSVANKSNTNEEAKKTKKSIPVSKPARRKKKTTEKFPSLSSDDDEDYVAPSHVFDPIESELAAMEGGFPERWVRESPAPINEVDTGPSLSTSAEPSTPKKCETSSKTVSTEPETSPDPLLVMFEHQHSTTHNFEITEAHRHSNANQSFNEDDLLVEIACDPKKNRKPSRTYMVPDKRRLPYVLTGRPRGRPRRIAVDQVEVKQEPV